MDEDTQVIQQDTSLRDSQQNMTADETKIVDMPGFGEDFATTFSTDLEFIDHTNDS